MYISPSTAIFTLTEILHYNYTYIIKLLIASAIQHLSWLMHIKRDSMSEEFAEELLYCL